MALSRKGITSGVALTLTWVLWILATRAGLETALSMYDLLALRFGVGCLIAVPVILYFRSWRGLSFKQFAVLGLLGGLPQTMLAYSAIERSPIEQVSVFMYGTTPFITAVLAFIFLRKSISLHLAGGTALTFFGILIMSLPQFRTSFDPQIWTGNAMAMAAITSFACYLIFAERWNISIAHSIIACTIMNGMIYLPCWAFFIDSNLSALPLQDVLVQGALQGLIPSLFAMFITIYTVSQIGATNVALFHALIPVCATIIAVPLLGEEMDVYKGAGISVATIGIMLSSLDISLLKNLLNRRLAQPS